MAPVVPGLDSLVRTAPTLPDDRGNVNLRGRLGGRGAASTGRPVAELAVDLGRGRWSTARLVYRLASVNLVEVVSGDAPAEATELPLKSSCDTSGAATLTEEDLGEPSVAAPWGAESSDQEEAEAIEDESSRRLSDGPPPLESQRSRRRRPNPRRSPRLRRTAGRPRRGTRPCLPSTTRPPKRSTPPTGRGFLGRTTLGHRLAGPRRRLGRDDDVGPTG